MKTETQLTQEEFNRWLEALRSGNYNEGVGKLYYKNPKGNESYCCLGVCGAVNNYDPELLKANFSLTKGEGRGPVWKIPHEIQQKLIQFNDDDGMTFSEIANWIEKNLTWK